MGYRRYKMRINVRTLKNGNRYACVTVSDDVAAMIDKPYVSVKRMQDRLAFVPWDNKTGYGTVVLNNNTLQFGVQEDCEKMLDFCGQYYLVNKTDSGIVFVKLADRHPFDREVVEYNGSTHDKCSELPPDTRLDSVDNPIGLYDVGKVPSLKELLKAEIEKKQKELEPIQKDIDAAKALLKEAEDRYEEVNIKLRAFCSAYNYIKDGE